MTVTNNQIAHLSGPLSTFGDTSVINELIDDINSVVVPGQIDANASTLVLTTAQAGSTIRLNRAAGVAVDMPLATGSGRVYNFVTVTTVTSNGYLIPLNAATDDFIGFLMACSTGDTPDLGQPWLAAATDNRITLNGSTTGGIKGEAFSLEDVAAGVYLVRGQIIQSGSEATPFSTI